MEFIQSEKVDKLICDYNANIRVGSLSKFDQLARQALVTLKCDEKLCVIDENNKVLEALNSLNYFELLQKWLEQEKFTHVILQNIKCVLISTEILGENFQNYSGFAQKIGDAYYVYVLTGESVERTISILTHEIVHIALERVFQKYEKQKCEKNNHEVEEKIVIYVEHYVMKNLFGIARDDLTEEEERESKKFSTRMTTDGNLDEYIFQLLSNSKR